MSLCCASVHGISRSATVVLAYLMRQEGRRLDTVIENVLQRKPDIRLKYDRNINTHRFNFGILIS